MRFNSLNRWLDQCSTLKHQYFIMAWLVTTFLVGGFMGWLMWNSVFYHATYLSLQILFLLYRFNWCEWRIGLPKKD